MTLEECLIMIEDEERIPLDLYKLWQEDRVTKAFTEFLEKAVEEAKEARLNRNLTVEADGQLKANYYLGYQEAIGELLEKFTYDCTTERKQ